jgi:hypothetical protein
MFNQIAADLLAVASITSLLLLLLNAFAREFESVALLWIRVLKRIQAEFKKTFKKKRHDPKNKRNSQNLGK